MALSKAQKRRITQWGAAVVLEVANYATYRSASSNRREFDIWVADRPHIKVAGQEIEYINGVPVRKYAPTAYVGNDPQGDDYDPSKPTQSIRYYVVRGLTQADIDSLQPGAGMTRWLLAVHARKPVAMYEAQGQTKKPGSHSSARHR